MQYTHGVLSLPVGGRVTTLNGFDKGLLQSQEKVQGMKLHLLSEGG
jgi:hypothetical protein